MDFRKTSASHILLNTVEFEGGSGILDNESISAQKAFKDINDRLLLATETYDGLMSSADKLKLNDFIYDVLSKKEFVATADQIVFDCEQPIVRATVFVDGILLSSNEYSFVENETTLSITGGTTANSAVTVYFTNGLVANAVVDDAVTDTSHTWSSDKISSEIAAVAGDVPTLVNETVVISSDTITLTNTIVKISNMYVVDLGEITLASVGSINGNDIVLSDTTLDGESIEVVYTANI